MEIRVREHRLPGVGRRYELEVEKRRSLSLVVEDAGRRELGLIEEGADEPRAVVSLSHAQAIALSALLAGARFSVDTSSMEDIPGDEIEVETVSLGPSSPAVGIPVADVPLPDDSDAMILAVIRDDTEVVEEDPVEPSRAGDRIVVSARRDRLTEVVRYLAG